MWQVEARLPAGLAVGNTEVRLRVEGAVRAPVSITLCEPEPTTPVIVTVRNASDYGTNVQTRGPKA